MIRVLTFLLALGLEGCTKEKPEDGGGSPQEVTVEPSQSTVKPLPSRAAKFNIIAYFDDEPGHYNSALAMTIRNFDFRNKAHVIAFWLSGPTESPRFVGFLPKKKKRKRLRYVAKDHQDLLVKYDTFFATIERRQAEDRYLEPKGAVIASNQLDAINRYWISGALCQACVAGQPGFLRRFEDQARAAEDQVHIATNTLAEDKVDPKIVTKAFEGAYNVVAGSENSVDLDGDKIKLEAETFATDLVSADVTRNPLRTLKDYLQGGQKGALGFGLSKRVDKVSKQVDVALQAAQSFPAAIKSLELGKKGKISPSIIESIHLKVHEVSDSPYIARMEFTQEATFALETTGEDVASRSQGQVLEFQSPNQALSYRVTPVGGSFPLNQLFKAILEVDSSGGEAVTKDLIKFDATMPQHNHGMNVTPKVHQIYPGRFVIEGLLLHMPGSWEVEVSVMGQKDSRGWKKVVVN